MNRSGMPRIGLLYALAVAQAVFPAGVGAAPPTTAKEVMNIVAIAESNAFAASALSYLGYVPPASGFRFRSTYDETGFTSDIAGDAGGAEYTQTSVGTVTGDYGHTISIAVDSSGAVGSRTFSAQSQLTWEYDAAKSGYSNFSFTQSGTAGDGAARFPTSWIWPVAVWIFENIILPVIISYPLELLRWLGIMSPAPTVIPAPISPPPPVPVVTPISLYLDGGLVRELTGDESMAPNVGLEGNFDAGRFNGSVAVVPEPSNSAMMLLGLALLALIITRRRKDRANR